MKAYQVKVNGKLVATAGLKQGVMSAIANWVSIPGEGDFDPDNDWHAGFSLAGLDTTKEEDLKWFRTNLKVGDEITLKLVEIDQSDLPTEIEPRKKNEKNRTSASSQ